MIEQNIEETNVFNNTKKVEEQKKYVNPIKLSQVNEQQKDLIKKVEETKKKKEISDEEKITILAEKLFNEAKKSNKMFITLNDINRNFWNSSDGTGLFISQGRCREMPEEISEVLKHALSEDNKLLREATDIELLNEMRFRAREHLIVLGEVSAKKIEEKKISL
jgi:FKBP-type peptidyl-prolyl cis-trans isomerase 2